MMGQIEVFELLKAARESGNDAYFTIKEVKQILKDQGHTSGLISGVPGDLARLEYYGYCDVKMNGKFTNWKRMFRLKNKYVKTSKGRNRRNKAN